MIELIKKLEIKTDRRSLRIFGFGVSLILFLALSYQLVFKAQLVIWLLILPVIILATTLISHRLVLPVYYPWLILTKTLGLLITYTLLILAFFLIITPMGLIMRGQSGNPFRRKLDAASYWSDLSQDSDKRMTRMF